jgi:hypothetical protein
MSSPNTEAVNNAILLFDTAWLNAVVALIRVHGPECGATAVTAAGTLCCVAANVALVFLLLSTPDSETVECAVIRVVRITRTTMVNGSVAISCACAIDAHYIVTAAISTAVYNSPAVAFVAAVDF